LSEREHEQIRLWLKCAMIRLIPAFVQ